jgi:CMP-N,N'-diacetyllegionaminic acid synthase
MAIIGLITARGGSKGIPGKNIALCVGRPLLAHTAVAALNAKSLDRVILSTDDPTIASVGKEWGLDVPFVRPTELASDKASSLSVMAHALKWAQNEGTQVDAIVLLQPTSPLRVARHIDEAVALLLDSDADTVVSVMEVPHRFHPQSLMRIEEDRLHPLIEGSEFVLRRQDLPTLYARNGPAILVIRPSQIATGNFYSGHTVPYVMSTVDSLDIDTPEDLEVAEAVMSFKIFK